MIVKPSPENARAIKSLIDFCAKKNEMLQRPLSEIYAHIREFFVFREKGKILGCCALRITWGNLAEIRSLAVDQDHRSRGIGAKLVKACIKEAKQLEIPKIFTLTNKPDFFNKQGFRKVNKERLPMKVWGECVKCNKYTDCDEVALVYKVKI